MHGQQNIKFNEECVDQLASISLCNNNYSLSDFLSIERI
jgi:hypothetical protein